MKKQMKQFLCAGCNQTFYTARINTSGYCKDCYQKKYFEENRKSKKVVKKYLMKKDQLYGFWQLLEDPIPNIDIINCLCTACNQTKRFMHYNELFKGGIGSTSGKHCGCQYRKKSIKSGQIYDCWQVLVPPENDNYALCKCIYCGDEHKVEYVPLTDSNRVKKCKCRKSKIASGTIKILSDGTPLIDYCNKFNVNWHNAYEIYRVYGEESFKTYCETYSGPNISSLEIVFINLMKDIFPEIEKYDKNPLEFKTSYRPDFRLEKNNKILYINVDGLFYHSMGSPRKLNKDYHQKMYKNFNDNNYNIFQFYSNELRDKPQIVKSIILNHFNLSKKIFARKCKIQKINGNIAKEFYEKNHLMGFNEASQHYGLIYNEEIVSMISVKKYNKQNIIEISRFCSLLNINVIGGFSKLYSFIIKQYTPDQIVSFCDMRHSTGNSYKKLEFSIVSEHISWKWTDGYNIFNRLKCRANMDKRSLSESEYAKELGWYKIYDAGQIKWYLDLKRKIRI